MRQIHHPYMLWEDYHAGMYAAPADMEGETSAARELLANPDGLIEAMRDAAHAWPYSAEHNLTNEGQNRRAWLGHAACLHSAGARRDATCAAWGELTEDQRDEANAQADRVISEWEESRDGIQALFV